LCTGGAAAGGAGADAAGGAGADAAGGAAAGAAGGAAAGAAGGAGAGAAGASPVSQSWSESSLSRAQIRTIVISAIVRACGLSFIRWSDSVSTSSRAMVVSSPSDWPCSETNSNYSGSVCRIIATGQPTPAAITSRK
jgi:hypothetical protein